MGPGMMTKKYKVSFFAVFIFFSLRIFAATTQSNWIIGAQKFSFTRNQTGSVEDGIALMFPARILEKISSNMYRNLYEDEKADRELYKLRQERNSLFLQLSSEVKKRDSLFLEKYSQSELNRKIVEAEKKIDEIKNKLKANLESQKAYLEISYDGKYFAQPDKNQTVQKEKVSVYKNDFSALFNPSDKAKEQGIKGALYEKEAVNEKINCLITGQITAYDEFISLTVETYIFPGAKLASTITEIGTIDDADFIASNIVRQLSPVITNSIPVAIKIVAVSPQDQKGFKTYIDDILYNSIEEEFIVDSGVHHIQFIADGYQSVGTNYYFEGNKYYNITVELEPEIEQTIYVDSKKPVDGLYLMNGVQAEKLSDGKAKITINGNPVLGQFITDDNLSAFFYIPQKKIEDGALYTSILKPLDHSEYIEKYRKRMYVSYSVLVTSLVPTLVTQGRLASYVSLFNDSDRIQILRDKGTLDKKYNEAKIWNTTAIVCTGISVAAGVWFVFELYRYFSAANSVLPANTKISFDYEEPAAPVEAVIEQNEPPQEESQSTVETNTTE